MDLPAVLARVLDLLEGEAERRGLSVRRDLPPVPPVAGDEERLRQVVMNLALNALDAMGRGGALEISCRLEAPDAPEVAVFVDDEGPGVPRDIRDRVFEPFFTTKATGSGLGLSIVHAIVTQHGGSIEVEDAPAGGARFALRLPRA